MTDSFVALDVETANEDFASICAIGVVAFSGNEVLASSYTLVNPEDSFSGFNISIHGIGPEDVSSAPTFPEVAGRLATLLGNRVVVTHTAFDKAALRQAHSRYGLRPTPCHWLDSACVARRAWPDEFAQAGYGLASVASWCGIEFDHHNALEDARAAGEVVLRAIADTGLGVEDWLTRVKKPIDQETKSGIRREGSPEGHLFGERVCGGAPQKLDTFDRLAL